MFASAKLAHFFYSAKFNGSFFAFFLLFLSDSFILCTFYDMEISWFTDGCGSSGAIGALGEFLMRNKFAFTLDLFVSLH